MSLILPNRQPPPQTGINYTVATDGGNVVVVVTATSVLSPADARSLAAGLVQAAEIAEAFRSQVLPVNGVLTNG